jgi:hypothetical protein
MQQGEVVRHCAGTRDGVPPTERVDAERLVAVFELAGVGLLAIQIDALDVACLEEIKM